MQLITGTLRPVIPPFKENRQAGAHRTRAKGGEAFEAVLAKCKEKNIRVVLLMIPDGGKYTKMHLKRMILHCMRPGIISLSIWI